MLTACYMCNNAHVDPDLNCDNDLSYYGIGEAVFQYRILFRSGDDRPTSILFEKWGGDTGWRSIAYYNPKYCPNCGRELSENQLKDEL